MHWMPLLVNWYPQRPELQTQVLDWLQGMKPLALLVSQGNPEHFMATRAGVFSPQWDTDSLLEVK